MIIKRLLLENWKISLSCRLSAPLYFFPLSSWSIPLVHLIKKVTRSKVKWIPPPCGWIKYNFDREDKGNPSLVGASGLCRDSRGSLVGVFAKPLNL